MKKIEHEHLIHLEEIYETSKVCKMFNVKSAYFAFSVICVDLLLELNFVFVYTVSIFDWIFWSC